MSFCLEADCVVMRNNPVKEAGKWADESCDNNRGYICQINAGTCLFGSIKPYFFFREWLGCMDFSIILLPVKIHPQIVFQAGTQRSCVSEVWLESLLLADPSQ